MAGQYFCYDNPSVIETEIEKDLSINSDEWALIFTIYSWPNIILPLLGGIFVDKVGIRPAIMLYAGLVTFGQMFVMIGGYAQNYALILTGRAIFGMGGECLGAAQVTIISMWFRG